MKMTKMRCGCLWGLAVVLMTVLPAKADPILPYLQPVATQLSNDNRTAALRIYHRDSGSLSGDISILRSLDDLLGRNAIYAPLLADAASNYATDFENRIAPLNADLLAAPQSASRRSAVKSVAVASNAVRRAVIATSTRTRIVNLGPAAQRLATAQRSVTIAVHRPVGFSRLSARIASFSFNAHSGAAAGTFGNGTLNFSAISNPAGTDLSGTVNRWIQLHLENVTTNAPETYLLGTNGNTASYQAIDLGPRQHTAIFEAVPGTTNSPSSLTIDSIFELVTGAITNRFVVGHFQFAAELTTVVTGADTNRTTVVTNGFFQLNY